MLTDTTVRPLTAEDEPAALALLSCTGPGEAPPESWGRLLPAVWGWLRRSPDCELWGSAHADGRLAALLVLRRVPTWVAGRLRAWSELALVAAGGEPDPPGALELVSRALDSLPGAHAAGWELAFASVPSASAATWERALGFEYLRRETRLELDVREAPRELEPDGDEFVLRPLRDSGHEIAALSERIAGELEACSLRDAAFVRWRFCEHPIHRHRSLALRWHGQLIGYTIFRERADRMDVLEWQVPNGAQLPGARLLHALRQAARELGVHRIRAAQPDWSPWFARFQEAGFRVVGPDRAVTAVRAERARSMDSLRDGWLLQPGDFALA